MTLEKRSSCKVNLLLNILGRRADGFHELESVIYPLQLHDLLRFERQGRGVQLTCSVPELPTDSGNLVYRAAVSFLQAACPGEGVRIHLEKRIPLAAGLGGGSGNAAATFTALNELFGRPLSQAQLEPLAAHLGSDIPFFLQSSPALATGRGERIQSLHSFTALQGAVFLLIHPGFGVSTPWAYQNLARFPDALQGRPGRAHELIDALNGCDLKAAGSQFYNSLEAPVLEKYPLLALFQDFLRERGAAVALMSGSGSTTYAILPDQSAADHLLTQFTAKFGNTCWTATVPA